MKFPYHNVLRQVAWLLVISLPALFFWFLVRTSWINIPVGDDYPAILGWLAQWTEAAPAGEKLSLLLEQHFSHRIVTTRIVILLIYWFGGGIYLPAMQLVGWGAWLALVILLVWHTPRLKKSVWGVLATVGLLMNPLGFSNFVVAMQGPQNVGIHLVAFGAFWFAAQASRGAFLLSLTAGLVAVLTSINGLLVLPLMACFHVFRQSWGRFGWSAGLALLVWGGFFASYDRSQSAWDLGSFVSNFLVMVGSPVGLWRHATTMACGFGVVIVLLSIFVLFRRQTLQQLPVQWMFLSFLGLSCLMAAYGRIGWSEDYMLQDRYRIYGLLILVLLGGTVSSSPTWRGRRWLKPFLAGLAVVYGLLGYWFVAPSVLSLSHWQKTCAANLQLGRYSPIGSEEVWPEDRDHLSRAIALGLYEPPKVLSAAVGQNILMAEVGWDETHDWAVSRSPSAAGYWLIGDPALSGSLNHLLYIEGRNRALLPKVYQRSTLRELVTSGRLISRHHRYRLPLSVVVTGEGSVAPLDLDQISEGARLRSTWIALPGPTPSQD